MVHFSPMTRGANRYLVSTGLDGCVCFWSWNVAKMSFDPKPLKFVERSRAGAGMRCSSFSPGGKINTSYEFVIVIDLRKEMITSRSSHEKGRITVCHRAMFSPFPNHPLLYPSRHISGHGELRQRGPRVLHGAICTGEDLRTRSAYGSRRQHPVFPSGRSIHFGI